VTTEMDVPKKISAPIKKGDKVGTLTYKIGDEHIAEIDLVSDSDVARAGFWRSFWQSVRAMV